MYDSFPDKKTMEEDIPENPQTSDRTELVQLLVTFSIVSSGNSLHFFLVLLTWEFGGTILVNALLSMS